MKLAHFCFIFFRCAAAAADLSLAAAPNSAWSAGKSMQKFGIYIYMSMNFSLTRSSVTCDNPQQFSLEQLWIVHESM